jgi:hypothetical protein
MFETLATDKINQAVLYKMNSIADAIDKRRCLVV